MLNNGKVKQEEEESVSNCIPMATSNIYQRVSHQHYWHRYIFLTWYGIWTSLLVNDEGAEDVCTLAASLRRVRVTVDSSCCCCGGCHDTIVSNLRSPVCLHIRPSILFFSLPLSPFVYCVINFTNSSTDAFFFFAKLTNEGKINVCFWFCCWPRGVAVEDWNFSLIIEHS